MKCKSGTPSWNRVKSKPTRKNVCAGILKTSWLLLDTDKEKSKRSQNSIAYYGESLFSNLFGQNESLAEWRNLVNGLEIFHEYNDPHNLEKVGKNLTGLMKIKDWDALGAIAHLEINEETKQVLVKILEQVKKEK
jgi:hypothetical protein